MAKTVTKMTGNAAAKAEAIGYTANDLIRGEDKIRAAVHNVLVQNRSHHRQLHIVAVSAIVHTAEHGQPAILNTFYDGLTESQRRSFRQYLIRHCVQSKADEYAKGLGAGPDGWLVLDRKSQAKPFVVISNKDEPKAETKPSDRRAKWIADVSEKLIRADAKGFRSWFDSDPRKGVDQDNMFHTEQFVERFERLFTMAAKEGKSDVSGEIIQLSRNFLETLKTAADAESRRKEAEAANAAKAEAGETGTMPPVPPKAEATQPATKH